ncbi:RidA family protein [Algoriphagus sp.]|uniref:RidA family protein n=1 Tax=Algoriphagus sp. TaxID=1872435 RepID=UPI002630F7A6|nr:RidA family protein [Algoriphagus sp.]
MNPNNDLFNNLKKLGLTLPEPSIPGGNYQSLTIRGQIIYLSIQFPIVNGKNLFLGKLGQNISTQEGYQAMQLCGLNLLAQIYHKVGFDHFLGFNHLDIYYRGSEGWDDGPIVANGASDLLVNSLGKPGLHSRSIFGVQNLPRDFCVGLSGSASLKM